MSYHPPGVITESTATKGTEESAFAEEPPPGDEQASLFSELKEAVLGQKPVLREVIEKYGSKSLYEYAKQYNEVRVTEAARTRQQEFLTTFGNEAERLLGASVAKSAVTQLQEYPSISTSDHHGPLVHPFFLNSNLLASAPSFEKTDPLMQNVIVFACGNVSLNNSSYPRGILFQTQKNGSFVTHRFSLFPSSMRQCPVFALRAYTKEDATRMKKAIREKCSEGDFSSGIAGKVIELVENIFEKPEVLGCNMYSDQVTILNAILWKRYFGSTASDDAPNLLYMEIESLVSKILIEHHIGKDTTIDRMLFDPAYAQLVRKYFDGIDYAFSTEEKSGTYFFWGLPREAKYRMQLWKEGSELVADNSPFRVPLTPDAIRDALERRELIPGTLLCYIVLSLYYGVKCMGGIFQINYLTKMKDAYLRMHLELEDEKNIAVAQDTETRELYGDVALAYLGDARGQLSPATGIDLLLYGNEKTWPIIRDSANMITLAQGLDPMMPEFYRIIYPEAQRDPRLLAVRAEDIARSSGLADHLSPCAYVD